MGKLHLQIDETLEQVKHWANVWFISNDKSSALIQWGPLHIIKINSAYIVSVISENSLIWKVHCMQCVFTCVCTPRYLKNRKISLDLSHSTLAQRKAPLLVTWKFPTNYYSHTHMTMSVVCLVYHLLSNILEGKATVFFASCEIPSLWLYGPIWSIWGWHPTTRNTQGGTYQIPLGPTAANNSQPLWLGTAT